MWKQGSSCVDAVTELPFRTGPAGISTASWFSQKNSENNGGRIFWMTLALRLCVLHLFDLMCLWPTFLKSLFPRSQNWLQFPNYCLNPSRCLCRHCTVLHWHQRRRTMPLRSASGSLKYPRYRRCHLGLSGLFLSPSLDSSPSAVGLFPGKKLATLKTNHTANPWKHHVGATASLVLIGWIFNSVYSVGLLLVDTTGRSQTWVHDRDPSPWRHISMEPLHQSGLASSTSSCLYGCIHFRKRICRFFALYKQQSAGTGESLQVSF